MAPVGAQYQRLGAYQLGGGRSQSSACGRANFFLGTGRGLVLQNAKPTWMGLGHDVTSERIIARYLIGIGKQIAEILRQRIDHQSQAGILQPVACEQRVHGHFLRPPIWEDRPQQASLDLGIGEECRYEADAMVMNGSQFRDPVVVGQKSWMGLKTELLRVVPQIPQHQALAALVADEVMRTQFGRRAGAAVPFEVTLAGVQSEGKASDQTSG